jgi:stage V sporulation protein D (sporulation-specific penicillin-binding protein)
LYKDFLVKRRLIIFIILIFIFGIVLVIRLGYVMFFLTNKIAPMAYDQWTRDVPIEGKRGDIYDRNGKLIVGNSLSPSVAVIKRQIKDKDYVVKQLSSILDCDERLILKHIEKNVSVELIKPEGRRISKEQAERIVNLNMDGVYVVGDTKRYYPYGEALSHVLGFTGIDNQGICGIEYIYDDYLKGQNGNLSIYTDAKGHLMPDMVSYYNEASKGFDIYLTIDIDIQLIIENIIDEAVRQYSPEEMTILVEEPNTGEILAMASYPSFDPANWRNYPQEIYNRNLAIWKSFEPGSTFKIVTFSAGLEEGSFKLNDTFFDPGFRMVGGARIKDWKAGGHGTQTFKEILQNSCNPGFMEIGFRLGKEKLFNYIHSYGFGEKSGIDLLGEAKGIVFKDSNIGPVELATSSFGQGNSSTPIQLTNAMSASINGGNLLTPYVLKKIVNELGDVVLENTPVVKRRVISENTSALMRHSLESVSALGTGRNAYVDGYRVGGKTGTAQKVGPNGAYMQGNYILSFLGAAPMNDPKAVVYLAIDNPKNTIQYGGVVAAPMVGEIFEQILPLLNVKKDYKNQIEKELRWFIDTPYHNVHNFININKSKIKPSPYYKYLYAGNGDTVIDQEPASDERILEGGTIILYLG